MDGIERKLLGVCGFGKVVVNAVADVDVKIFSAKGGITFSGIGTKALKVRRALVMGQIRPGIPVWQTGAESRFPGISYVIFPDNVGEDTSARGGRDSDGIPVKRKGNGLTKAVSLFVSGEIRRAWGILAAVP